MAKRRAKRRKLSYNLTLPLPPSINSYWGLKIGQTTGGKNYPMKYVTHHGRKYKGTIESEILKAYPAFRPITTTIRAAIAVEPGTARKEDIDNRLKPLFDSLEGILFPNDNQIKKLSVEMLPPKSPGTVYVILEEIGDPV